MTVAVAPTVLPTATASRTAVWLFAELRGRYVGATAAIAFGLGAAAGGTIPVYLLGSLIDRVRNGAAPSTLVGPAAAIGAVVLIGGVASGLAAYQIRNLGERTVADLREQVVERALGVPAATIEDSGRGDLLSRVGSDVAAVSKAASQVVPTTVNALFLGFVTLIAMTSMDWRLGLAGLLSLPAYVAALRWYLPRSGPLYAEERVAGAAFARTIVEALQGAKTIDAYEIHEKHLVQFEVASNRVRGTTIAVFALVTRFVGRVNAAEFFGLAATLVTGFVMVRSGTVTVGQATAAALMFFRLFGPIGMLMYQFDEAQSGAASLARLVGVVDLRTPRASAAHPIDILPTVSTLVDVVVEDVSFSYNRGSEVLRNVSLRIPAGTTCALVGSTGAGKTTLAGVIAGLLEPNRGHVRIGGVAIGELGQDQLSQWIATISQDIHVFSGRLIDDLRLGAPNASRDEIWTVLHQLGAGSWVAALDVGLDTLVGEEGVALTAAQAQQLSLARLALANPRVAVLDEATAEAGSANATELEDAAAAVTSGRTALIVAHRLTQAATADHIALMANGCIVEHGTHAELLALKGRYAQLWEAWRTPE